MATGDDRVGLLFWEMTLDDKEFKEKIKDSKKGLKNLDKGSKTNLKSIAKGFAGVGLAAVAAGAAITAFAADTVQGIAEQKILADSIGATVAEVEGLEIASKKLGVESSMVVDKMREFGGINEFKKLADQVKGAGSATDQLNKAVEIFGGEGTKILPILQQGSEGLAKFEQQAIKTGNALSPKQIKEAEEAWDAYQDTQIEISGAVKQLGVSLSGILPVLTRIIRTMRNTGKATSEVIEGFRLWTDEILGLEDKRFDAFTAAERAQMKQIAQQRILAKEQKKVAKEAKNFAEEMNKVTFSSEFFSELNLEKDLLRVRKALGLNEEGFKKVEGTVLAALKRNESALTIIETLMENIGNFKPEDFSIFVKESKLDLGLLDELDEAEKKLSNLYDKNKEKREEAIKTLVEGFSPQKFASKALAGSIDAFRIIQGGKDTPAKETAANTKKMAKMFEKLGVR